MKGELDRQMLLRLNERLSEQIGLFCPPNRIEDFEKCLKAAAKSCNMEPHAFALSLTGKALSPDQVDVIAHHFTIGETYFFREPRVLEILEDEVLWRLIQERRKTGRYLRLWSAACCSGEEVYSLAIMLRRLLSDIDKWKIELLATDINPSFLKKAKRGLYSEWSFRLTPPAVKSQFFSKHGRDKFQIADEIKSMVRFSTINLADPSLRSIAPASMDVILCRNVLMYFHPDQIKQVLMRLHSVLAERGVLVLSPAEFMTAPDQLFEPLPSNGAILRKRAGQQIGSLYQESDTQGKRQAPADVAISPISVSFADALQAESSRSLSPVPQKQERGETDADLPLDQRARLLFDQGLYRQCARTLMDFCAEGKTEPHHLTLLTKAFSNQGDMQAALKWIDHAIERDKLSHALYYLRATILQELGATKDAIVALRQALFLHPSFVVAEFHLAALLLASGKTKEASKRLNSALHLLKQYKEDEIVPDSEGITAGHLTQMVESLLVGRDG